MTIEDSLRNNIETMLTYKDGSPELHISHIALMRGGQLILEAINENGTPKLRNAISTYAQNGGSDIVHEAIRALWPDGGGDALTDEQVGELADYIVANFKP
jgi:ketol-acid reductoisomerase